MGGDQQMWQQLFETARLGQNAASGAGTLGGVAADIYGAMGAGSAAGQYSKYSNLGDILGGIFGKKEAPKK